MARILRGARCKPAGALKSSCSLRPPAADDPVGPSQHTSSRPSPGGAPFDRHRRDCGPTEVRQSTQGPPVRPRTPLPPLAPQAAVSQGWWEAAPRNHRHPMWTPSRYVAPLPDGSSVDTLQTKCYNTQSAVSGLNRAEESEIKSLNYSSWKTIQWPESLRTAKGGRS